MNGLRRISSTEEVCPSICDRLYTKPNCPTNRTRSPDASPHLKSTQHGQHTTYNSSTPSQLRMDECMAFSWLVLQNKLWTADRILRHGGQANAICQLCCATLTQKQPYTCWLNARMRLQFGLAFRNGLVLVFRTLQAVHATPSRLGGTTC
jgi:hypothetical protein